MIRILLVYLTCATALLAQPAPGDRAAEDLARMRLALADAGERPSVALLYNAGVYAAYLGQHGKALWHLLRAQAAAPRDPDIAQNVRFVRRALGQDPPRGLWTRLESLHAAYTLREWAAAAFALQLVGLLLWVFAPRGRRRLGAWIAVLGLLCAALAVARWAQPPGGVVLVETATVRRGPHAELASVGRVVEGDVVVVRGVSRHWVEIEALDGTSGWVGREQVGLLESAAHP